MRRIAASVFAISLIATSVSAQEVVRLYNAIAPGSESWAIPEQTINPPFPGITGVANISTPTLTVYRPKAGKDSGTGIIVAPGGAFHFLALDHEGKQVAEWLAERGVTAFVLKYRVLQTDGPHQGRMFSETVSESAAEQGAVFPLSVADAKRAIAYVREHARDFQVDPQHVGIIGFSAGAMVALSIAVTSPEGQGPNFVAALYPSIQPYMRPFVVPADAPPIFLTAATDDDLGFASDSAEVYNAWIARRRPAELHLYAKGGHGFGMFQRGLPVDSWTARFEDWLRFNGLLR